MRYTSPEEQVNYGLDGIDENRFVEIHLKDLIFIFKTFGELNSFFHQPLHFQEIEDLKKFIGNKDSGAYRLIHQNYYKIIQKYIPDDIMRRIGEGEFDSPSPPEYFKARK